MDFKTYQTLALETMADQEKILERLKQIGPDAMQLYNGMNGLTNELGELADHIKSYIEYGGEYFDIVGMMEEIGDALWRLGQIADAVGTDLETCANLNLEKLKRARYKSGKFTEKEAHESGRDRQEERSILEMDTMDETWSQDGNGFAQPPEVSEEPDEDSDLDGVIELPSIKLCPHDANPADCNQCAIESDFQYDAFRERR